MSGIVRAISSWTQTIESASQLVVRVSSLCLPSRVRELALSDYLPQGHLLVYTLGLTILLQGTFGNPVFESSPEISGGIVATGVVLTAGVLCKHLGSHMRQVRQLPTKKQIACVAIPLTLAAIETSALLGTDAEDHLPPYAYISLALWGASLIPTSSIGAHTYLIANQAPNEEVLEEGSVVATLEVQLYRLEAGLEGLTTFIHQHEDLERAIQERIASHREQIPWMGPLNLRDTIPGYDPENPVHYLAGLRVQIRRRQFEIREINEFIERHPDLRALFEQHLQVQNIPLLSDR